MCSITDSLVTSLADLDGHRQREKGPCRRPLPLYARCVVRSVEATLSARKGITFAAPCRLRFGPTLELEQDFKHAKIDGPLRKQGSFDAKWLVSRLRDWLLQQQIERVTQLFDGRRFIQPYIETE
jgi:hypothetical protein